MIHKFLTLDFDLRNASSFYSTMALIYVFSLCALAISFWYNLAVLMCVGELPVLQMFKK